jgi:glycerate kinase
MKQYLLAFDKFKGSLTASEACDIAARAIDLVEPESKVVSKPLTDGGEGFCEIVTNALGGEFRDYRVTYPDFRKGDAYVGYVMLEHVQPTLRKLLDFPDSGLMAIVEMAQAAGHQQVDHETRDVWNYTTAGVGELLRYASIEGASHVLMGMGGSATNDMGVGLLEALGMQSLSKDGTTLYLTSPGRWEDICKFEAPHHLTPLSIRIACDVKNPLHGNEGSAAIYGPQKGLKDEDLSAMQKQMVRISELLLEAFPDSEANPETQGMGAAGGLPFGLSLAFDTRLLPGFELICEILDLEKSIAQSDVILTGEGSMDASSLQGKGPYEIVRRGIKAGKKVGVFAGKVFEEANNHLLNLSDLVHVHQVGDSEASIEENIKNEPANLSARIQKHAQDF